MARRFDDRRSRVTKPPPLPPPRNDVELVNAETLGENYGRLLRFHLRYLRFDGTWSDLASRDCFDSGHAAIVLPYEPITDRVVLIRQFRTGPWVAGAEPWILECIAGRLDKTGATAEKIAHTEAREEAGLTLLALEPIPSFFTSPGIFCEHLTAYCGRITAGASGVHGLATEQEDIRAETYSAWDAIRMALAGEITSGPSLVCLYWLALNRERLRALWM